MIFLFQVKEAVPINPDGSVGDEDDTGNEEVGVCVLEDGMGVRAKCVCVFACVCVWGGGHSGKYACVHECGCKLVLPDKRLIPVQLL